MNTQQPRIRLANGEERKVSCIRWLDDSTVEVFLHQEPETWIISNPTGETVSDNPMLFYPTPSNDQA